MKNLRHYSLLDQCCMNADTALRAIFGKTKTTGRQNPAATLAATNLSKQDSKHAAGLMRVNHTGEICAQALYHAQGFISRDTKVKAQMQQAAIEEGDHLTWCNERLKELGSRTSFLNPFWYMGSFMIGIAAGLIGDEWNLGFLAETENQVMQHLESHLQSLPKDDLKSLCIIQQMHQDEAKHRDEAIHHGAKALPALVKQLMRATSKVMVKVAYWI